jgi:hypothetical protein
LRGLRLRFSLIQSRRADLERYVADADGLLTGKAPL